LTEHRRQRLRRALPIVALALVAFAIGIIFGAHRSGSAATRLADTFVHEWARGDYAGMYAQIDEGARRDTSSAEFAQAYAQTLREATAIRVRVSGRARRTRSGEVQVPVRVDTRLFGTLRLPFTIQVAKAGAEGTRVAWSRSLLFPGLRTGELLKRTTTLPRRAPLLARDGSVLAEAASGSTTPGSEGTRSSPLGEYATAVLGSVGAIPASRRHVLEAQGVPGNASVGLSGMEEALDDRLRGTPGGDLLAVDASNGTPRRVLAQATARAAPPLRSSISPSLQRAAVTALGSQLGGIVALQPSTGQILAVAGLGLDGLQPPGSTFKMVTVTGVLEHHLASLHSTFAYATYATLDGVKLENANGEECGGSLETAFAVSCNSVFAPLGAKLGANALVHAAEQYGFNHATGLPGVPASTLPAPSHIEGELDVGSTAIGQGQVLATPLQMAIVAATIGSGGRRAAPTFADSAPGSAPQVIGASLARTVRHLMLAVVRFGTGTAASIPGVLVAGKTGTAELGTECHNSASETGSEGGAEGSGHEGERCKSGAENTDAWFAAFAPALHPRIAVCVMLVKAGAGGATAAPAAREVIEAGLRPEAHL
jgi:Penicillin binding protein transpeptidase domain/Penicillin-binding Protein dimerisation domain/NTF2-like N-terminal transpeptidase domain